MMLTFGQSMLCLTAQMKKSNSQELDFLAIGILACGEDSSLRRLRASSRRLSLECEPRALLGLGAAVREPIPQPERKKAPHFAVLRSGWGIGIRTPTNRVRVCRAAVTQFPNFVLNGLYFSITVHVCQGVFKNFLKMCFWISIPEAASEHSEGVIL